MSNMICPKCQTTLSVRKSKRASYAAPEILYCGKCGYSAMKPDGKNPLPPKETS